MHSLIFVCGTTMSTHQISAVCIVEPHTLCSPLGQTGSGHVLGSCLHPCSDKTPPHSGSGPCRIPMPCEPQVGFLSGALRGER